MGEFTCIPLEAFTYGFNQTGQISTTTELIQVPTVTALTAGSSAVTGSDPYPLPHTSPAPPTGLDHHVYLPLLRKPGTTWNLATVAKAYTYDGVGRLTASREGTSTTAYTYDAVGNRLTVTQNGTLQQAFSYTAKNQVQSWSYDTAGNLLNDGTQAYQWDALGRLTQVTPNGQRAITYAYNGDGVLLKAWQGGTPTVYVQDTQGGLSQILEQRVAGVSTLYRYGLSRLTAETTTARTYAYHDRLGSVRLTLNAAGQPTTAQTYDAWGVPQAGGSAPQPFGFTGELQSAATGLQYLRARWYNPETGTLLGRDPFAGHAEQPYSLHPYAYAASQPTLLTDPSGRCWTWIFDDPTCPFIGWENVKNLNWNYEDGLAYWKGVLKTEGKALKAVITAPFDFTAWVAWKIFNPQQTYREIEAIVHRSPEENLALLWDGLVIHPLQEVIDAFKCNDPERQAEALTNLFLLLGSLHELNTTTSHQPRSTTVVDEVDGGVPSRPIPSARQAASAICSFTSDTPVATEDGARPIVAVNAGDSVLGYDERTGETKLFSVTAVFSHTDPVVVDLTLDGELITTTPEHPFYTKDAGWKVAGLLTVGDQVWTADRAWGTVESVVSRDDAQAMYNLTVDTAHTFFVGDGEWLVHNECLPIVIQLSQRLPNRNGTGPTAGYLVDSNGNMLLDEMIVSGNMMSLPPAPRSIVRDPNGILPTVGQLEFLHHVESKTAKYMQENNITDAILVINNHPCIGRFSCSQWLEKVLPQGATLRVIVPEGFDARGSFDQIFTGR